MSRKYRIAASAFIAIGSLANQALAQQLPGKHPGYLHALSDLHAAHWLLYHQPGDAKVYAGEDVAIEETNAAINEIKRASIDDGKDINDHPPIDVRDRGSHLQKAIEFLKKAASDIDSEEDNPLDRPLRHAAHDHIAKTLHATESAHNAWLQENHK